MFIKNNLLILISLCLLALTACNSDDDTAPVMLADCDDFSIQLIEAGSTIEVERSGGTAPFTYLWSTSETTPAIVFTESGTYSVTVTDAEDCETTGEIVVNTDIDCQGFSIELIEAGSTIEVDRSGGTAPFSYSWSTSETTAAINFTESGTYSVTVTDAEDCETTGEIVVNTDIDCQDFSIELIEAGSTIEVDRSGGIAPFSFLWSTSEITPAIVFTESGTYSVTVTDAEDCEASAEIVVTIDPVNCNGILNFNALNVNTPITFSADSEGYLFKSGCASVADESYDYNYVVVDVSWDSWGTGRDLNFDDVSDGIPGITFGSDGPAQPGYVTSPYHGGEDLFFDTGAQMNYVMDNIQVTITEASEVVGGQIAGTISGTIADQNDPNNTSSISGEFCVTLTTVCE